MNHFERHDGELFCEGVPLARIAAEVGTPTYVYSKATLVRHQRVWLDAWGDVDHRMCFAVKSCSSLAILHLLAKGGAGFDIVSEGELRRALLAGANPQAIVFSGVGKTRAELAAALEAGIGCFNVESEAELDMLNAVAGAHGTKAPISLRVNPDVDAKTHPYISTGLRRAKFGIAWDQALAAYEHARALPHLEIRGVDCHIGSQLESAAPFVEALDRLLDLVQALTARGIHVHHVDIGGGLGITYHDETPPSPTEYVAAVRARLAARDMERLRIFTEPGRVIVGNAGVLLTRVTLTKHNGDHRFVVLDAGMNDLIRPALYEAWHELDPVGPPRPGLDLVDVVGPVCETGDFFAKDRPLPPLAADDLVAIRSAGAYGMVMASNYNSRPRPAEVLVDGSRYHVIRRRETFEDLVRGEVLPE